MLGLALLLACALAFPIQLSHRTIDTNRASVRRSEPERLERGVFVIQFSTTIDPPLARRLATLIGYTPTEYVPTNAVVIFIANTTVAQSLTSTFGSKIKHFERLQNSDRRADFTSIAGASKLRSANTTMRATRGHVTHDHDNGDGDKGKRVRLRVLSFYGSMRAEEEEIDRAAEYTQQLASAMSAMRSQPKPIVDESAQSITVEDVDIDEAETAAEAIVDNIDDVFWVEIASSYELLNMWSVPAAHRAADGERTAAPSASQSTLWSPVLQLRGSNQTIGISDTGIENNCFFSDGLGAGAGSWATVNGISSVPSDNGHRKIRAYSNGVGGDYRDIGTNAGHGTHVVGIAAGRASAGSPSAKYNGAAPNARVAFVDMLPNTASRYLYVPDITNMLQWFYNAGARVKSASWGSAEGGAYTVDERNIDAFVWAHREMLVVIAAGNAGTEGSITAPGMNKNGLTVGATMNGYDAYALAETPPKSFAYTNQEWLASFSSRGKSTLPFQKPDIVAPGGQYVWSANNQAPLTGSCADELLTTTGYAGTSMATPLVAGMAANVRQMFEDDMLAGGTRLLDRDGGGGLPIYASLVRAVLAASGRPLKGIYPQKTFASVAARRNAEGFGRIALDRALGPAVALSVLSNERTQHGLTRTGSSVRACVGISDLAPGASLNGFELVIQLAYTDYPSSISAKAALVNNLDLRVTPIGTTAVAPVNINAANVSETKTTMERVIISPARAVDVQVYATQIGFGEMQTFSLIAVLRPIATTAFTMTRSLVVTPLSASSGICRLCVDNVLRSSSDCAKCGDGKVDANEQCEAAVSGTQCCNPATCAWRAAGTTCSTTVANCQVRGLCRAANGTVSCVADNTVTYSLTGADILSCTSVTNSTPPSVCNRPADDWFAELRTSGMPTTVKSLNSSQLRICCQPFERFAFERAPLDPIYQSLAAQYIAGRLNAAVAGATISADTVTALANTKTLLESRCATIGFATLADRTSARSLITSLTTFNEPSCASKVRTPFDTWCNATQASAANLFCSGAPNQFLNDKCKCDASRQDEPDCRHLSCSGHGASIYDFSLGQDRCVCLYGWTGTACERCATAVVPGTQFICVGMPTSLVTIGAPTRVLRAVTQSSVASRLNGTYYANVARSFNRTTPVKTADALPGADGLDCWCRSTSPLASSFATHYDALAAATSLVTVHAQWYGYFESELTTSLSTSMKSRASVSAASARGMTLLFAILVVAILQ